MGKRATTKKEETNTVSKSKIITKGEGENKMFYSEHIRSLLERGVKLNKPVLMIGETGVGKTSFVRELAIEEGAELIRINLTGQTGVDEFVGKYLANEKGTYWIDGMVIAAMRKGSWVVLDEINMALPDILSKIHSLLDDDRSIILNEKDGEKVVPHEDFRFFATMNDSDEYAGTKELNKAFLSRFPIVLDIGFSTKEVEILVQRTGIERKTAEDLVMLAKEMRKHKEEGKITYICSTRDLISCAELIMSDLPINSAVEAAILNKAPKDEQEALKKITSMVTDGRIDIPETKDSYTSISDLVEKAQKFGKDKVEWRKQIKKFEKDHSRITKDLEKARMEMVDSQDEIVKRDGIIVNLKKTINDFLDMVDKNNGKGGKDSKTKPKTTKSK